MKTNLTIHSMFVSLLRRLSKIAYRVIALFLFLSLPFSGKAQTHVGGGIYNNTVWLKVNSPYIVDSTVNVFSGVTLTIEPGVVVQFDTLTSLNLNNATLIAIGTSSDSIIFTSKKSNPARVYLWMTNYSTEWGGITASNPQFNNISYCKFEWALYAFNTYTGSAPFNASHSTFQNNVFGFHGNGTEATLDSCSFSNNIYAVTSLHHFTINHSLFLNNETVIEGGYHCQLNSSIFKFSGTLFSSSSGNRINNCVIDSNHTGVHDAELIENSIINFNGSRGIYSCDSIVNCTISNHSIGLDQCNAILGNTITSNDTAIFRCGTVFCNTICNNGLNVLANGGGTYMDYQNNYWCTSDSTQIAGTIYDGYDNSFYCIVRFVPFDTQACNLFNGIPEWAKPEPKVVLFPNPAQKNLTVSISDNRIIQIQIINNLGQILSQHTYSNSEVTLDIANLRGGMYWLEITTEHALVRKPFYKIE